MGAAVVAHGDAAPILEAAEHDLDAVALAVERDIVRDGPLARARRGDAGRDAAVVQGGAESGTIVAAVGDQLAGWWWS